MKKFIGSLLLILSVTFTQAQVRLTQAEYFWDTDPGQGNAIALSAANGNFNSALESLLNNVAGFPVMAGLHTFNIRIKDSQNQWGPVFRKIVTVDPALTNGLCVLSQAEYFWDNDPGQGNANTLLAFDGNFNSALETIVQAGLPIVQPSGKHVFYIRLKDSNGMWGPAFGKVIFIETICNTPLPAATSQSFCISATVADLVATGTNLKWYTSGTGGNILPLTATLVTATYYVSQTIDGCESARIPVAIATIASVSPTNITASPLTAGGTISWTVSNAPGSGYDYYYSTTPTAPNAGTVPTGNSSQTSVILGNLSSNTTYYVWVRSNCGANQGAWVGTTFTTPSPALANDFCGGSQALAIATSFDAGAVAGTLLNATTTSGIAPSCQENFSADVWYQIVAPASGIVTIETKAATTNSVSDTVIAAFTGSCGTLTQIGCNDDKVANTNYFSLLQLTGLTPGATIYIAVWKYQTSAPTAATSNFQIAAYNTPLANTAFEKIKIKIYPNPVSDYLNVVQDEIISKIEIVNSLGQTVIAKIPNSKETQLDVSQLATGTYIAKVSSESGFKIVKVLKQ